MQFRDLRAGKSVEGDEILSFRSIKKAKTYCYLIAGVHGDEVEGVYVLKNLIEWLHEQDDIQSSLVIIPVLNPDAYRAATRTNAHGVDLNRNLPANWEADSRGADYFPGACALSEPENIYLDGLFQKFPPHLIISLHSWKPMLNYNGDCEEVAKFLERYTHYPIVADDIKGHPTPGSLGAYAPKKYHSPVLTYELPVLEGELTLKEIWQTNAPGLQALLKSDLIAIKS